MQQNNSATNFFGNMQDSIKKMMENAPVSNPFDVRAAMEAQRKTFQAIADANKSMMQGWQMMAKRQTEMMSQFMQDNTSMASEAISASPEEKMTKQANLIKACCEKTMLNTQELTEMLRQNTVETAEVLNRRVLASLTEMTSAAKGE